MEHACWPKQWSNIWYHIYLASSESEAVTKIWVQTVIDEVDLENVVLEKVVRKGGQKTQVILPLCLFKNMIKITKKNSWLAIWRNIFKSFRYQVYTIQQHRNCIPQLGIPQLRTASKERTQAGGCRSSHGGEALGLADNTESIQQTEEARSNRKDWILRLLF